jgi:hypothetical protein
MCPRETSRVAPHSAAGTVRTENTPKHPAKTPDEGPHMNETIQTARAHTPAAPTADRPEGQLAEQLADRWAAGHARTIGCGPGWHGLISRLDRELAAACPGYRITRIRVRDGRLRYEIHLHGLPTHEPHRGRAVLAIRELVRRYETESSRVCEQTGAPGQLMRHDSQLRTLAPSFQDDGWTPATD